MSRTLPPSRRSVRRAATLFVLAVGGVCLLQGYTRLRTEQGSPQFRSNPTNIQFLVNNQTQAGLLNTHGEPTITADSAPVAAINAALQSWSGLADSTVSFLPAQLTAISPNGQDGVNVITFEDTPHNRQIVGDAIAVTIVFSTPSGSITESDILLNPDTQDAGGASAPFATTGAAGAFDIESTVLHELGHAVGMEHSNVFGASLWPFGRIGATHGRDLTADDIAFALDFYPQNGAQAQFGRIRGTASLTGGGAVRSGMAVAVNVATGVTISAQTDLSTGAYSILVPPGDYVVLLESLDGPAFPTNVALQDNQVTAPFQVTRFGGPGHTVAVAAGGETTADFLVSLGTPALDIGLVGIANGQVVIHSGGAIELPPGASDIYLWGTGLETVTQSQIQLPAPSLQIVPGSVGFNPSFPVDSYTGALFFTVFSNPIAGPPPSPGGRPLATILIESGGLTAAVPGGLALESPAAQTLAARLGVFIDGSWFLDLNGDSEFDSQSEIFGWGSPGDTPVQGDWNGDGVRDLGVYSGGVWFVDFDGNGQFDPAAEVRGWGQPGWTPAPGDWNGDGRTDFGVVAPDSTWFRDLNGDLLFDPVTEMHGWGSPGDIPVVGDWNGDGRDEMGVFSGGTWFIDRNGDGSFDPATEMKGWGVAGWTPIVGDWNGDGKDELGAIAPDSTWFRDVNGDFLFQPATEQLGWGSPGDRPVVADWNGDGTDDVGVFSGGVWFVDANGDGAFDPATEIKGWGVAGWTPVPGTWR